MIRFITPPLMSISLHLAVFIGFVPSATQSPNPPIIEFTKLEFLSESAFEIMENPQVQTERIASMAEDVSKQLVEIPTPVLLVDEAAPVEKEIIATLKVEKPKAQIKKPEVKKEKPKKTVAEAKPQKVTAQDKPQASSKPQNDTQTQKPNANLGKLRASFGGSVRAALMGSLRAPQNLSGVRAVVELSFMNGKIASIRLTKSSGNATFDKEVLRAAKQTRYPKGPKELGGKMLFAIPVKI